MRLVAGRLSTRRVGETHCLNEPVARIFQAAWLVFDPPPSFSSCFPTRTDLRKRNFSPLCNPLKQSPTSLTRRASSPSLWARIGLALILRFNYNHGVAATCARCPHPHSCSRSPDRSHLGLTHQPRDTRCSRRACRHGVRNSSSC